MMYSHAHSGIFLSYAYISIQSHITNNGFIQTQYLCICLSSNRNFNNSLITNQSIYIINELKWNCQNKTSLGPSSSFIAGSLGYTLLCCFKWSRRRWYVRKRMYPGRALCRHEQRTCVPKIRKPETSNHSNNHDESRALEMMTHSLGKNCGWLSKKLFSYKANPDMQTMQ